MLRSILKKVMWVGRATVFMVGLTVVLAVVLGVATTALAATGGNFLLGKMLGKSNAAGAVSKLTTNIAGPALRLINQSTASGATALSLNVASGKPPLTVNAAAGKATNLNADKVDGHDAPLWAVIESNGLADNWYGMTGNQRLAAGQYAIDFNRDISNCAYTATLSGINGQITTFGNPPQSVYVFTSDNAGNSADRSFHLVVNC